MTRKQESFLNDLHRLMKSYNITDMYPMTNAVHFVSNGNIFAVGRYDNDSKKPKFREVVSDYSPTEEALVFRDDEVLSIRKIEEEDDLL
jgi:hypothetical protein